MPKVQYTASSKLPKASNQLPQANRSVPLDQSLLGHDLHELQDRRVADFLPFREVFIDLPNRGGSVFPEDSEDVALGFRGTAVVWILRWFGSWHASSWWVEADC